jgi:glycosyltransferase involved in cell wall biosynthesis
MQPLRVVHMTSVHNAVDHRIFGKECRSLARAGFDVSIVGPHPEDTVKELVHIKSVPKDRSRLSRMTRTAWRVYRKAAALRADVYHFHDPELIPVALLLRTRGKIVVYDIHEDLPKDIFFKPYLPNWSKRLIAKVVERIELSAARRLSAVVAVTPLLAARFKAINSQTLVLYNYPYPEDLTNGDTSSWDCRKHAVTYVGTVTPQRGITEMVRAMGLLPSALTATLEIAGDQIPKEVTELPSWSRVNYHGALNQSSTYHLLRQARAGLVCEHAIPTFMESLPVKIFEYMGAGLPVIASNFPLWRDLLDSVGCALFVDPRNIREIAQAVEYLLTNPREAEAMGRRGQAAVINHFNWNTQAEKLVDLYVRLTRPPCVA